MPWPLFLMVAARVPQSHFDGTSELAPSLQVTFIGEQHSTLNVADKVRLSWNNDPATTMDIIWDQLHRTTN